ncbi:hypothetical protein MBRA_03764 [Methylobacterium brachiatum]|nr:hypothetical protein MBRA_03764 [Methylobacterium brachiatum]
MCVVRHVVRLAIYLLPVLAGFFAPVVGASAKDDFEESAIYLQVGYMTGDTFTKVEEGTGFLVHRSGWVITAKHVVEAPVPPDKQRVFYGSVASRFANRYQLFDIPTASVAADVALLRFSPSLGIEWPYLKIVTSHVFSKNDAIAAAGFPMGAEITVRKGSVTNLFGPKGYIGVDVGLAPGMSGGPVVLANSKCVVGLVAAGGGAPTFDFIVPVQYARAILDTISVEYVTEISAPADSGGDGSSTLFERSYQVDQTKDDHGMAKDSKYYNFTFDADKNSTITSAKLIETSAASAGDKSLNISADRKSATFRFKLESGPIYDQTRGWWHGQVVLTQQKTGGVGPNNASSTIKTSCS